MIRKHRQIRGTASNTTGRRLIIAAFLAGGLFAMAGRAAAQGSAARDEGRRLRPPIRASATVEVIDPARGVDEIISRVRDQKNRRGDSAKERTKEDSNSNSTRGDDDDKGRRGSGSGSASTGGAADRDRDPPPADKNDRPSYRPDRDRRDPRRQDSDARPSLPRDRRQTQTRR